MEVLSGKKYHNPYTLTLPNSRLEVFIVISGLGTVIFAFVLPETKGIPLEEMAKLFGDTDDIMVYAEDIHIDHNTHDLVVEAHGEKNGLVHVATEGDYGRVSGAKPGTVENIEHHV